MSIGLDTSFFVKVLAADPAAMTLGAELAAGHERGRLAMADAIILVSLLDANVEAIYTADADFARYPGVESAGSEPHSSISISTSRERVVPGRK